jgi:hypothetical protein
MSVPRSSAVAPLAETARAAIAALGLPGDPSGRALRRVAEVEAALDAGGSPDEGRETLAMIVIELGGGDPWRQP